ncbi:MAG: alpha/beta hydrolase [Nitrospiria bacterium]
MKDPSRRLANESGFIERGGLSLSYLAVLPDKPRAILIIVHGISEHKGRYLRLQNDLASEGFANYSYDQRGFGLSGGRRTHVERYRDYLHDLKEVTAFVRQRHPDQKVFLIGHSLGGMITAAFCIDFSYAVEGLVLSAPAYDVPLLPWFLEAFAEALSRIIPTCSIRYPSLRGKRSHDPEVDIAWENDPLIQSKATPRFYVEFRKMNRYLHQYAGKIVTPTLILQGRKDGIVRPEGAQTLFDHLQISQKRLIWYEGLYHEIFNEIGRERVISDLVNWLGGSIDGHSEGATVSEPCG